jgi:hypothetical protein
MAQTLPLYWVAPSAFEANVTYPMSQPVGQVTVGCPIDNYTNKVIWGDGTETALNSPGNNYKIFYKGQWITLIGPGTFLLYATSDKAEYRAALNNIPREFDDLFFRFGPLWREL